MLPGFRFLSAAILLSISILVFGVGAAALLRASHEQFVSSSLWRNGPLAQAPEPPTQPVLAILRVEPAPTVTSPQDQVPTMGLPATEPVSETEQAAANSDETARKDEVETQAHQIETPADKPAASDAPTSAKVEVPPPAPTPTEASASSSESTAASAEASPAPTLAKPGDTQSNEPQQADTTPAPASEPNAGKTTTTTTATTTPNDPGATTEPAAKVTPDRAPETTVAKQPAATTAPSDPSATVESAVKITPDGATETTAAKRPARRTKKRIARRPPQPQQQQAQEFYFPFGIEPSPANTGMR